MARCLPFPQPDYLLNGARREERAATEKRRKKEKRRRKEEEEELEEGEIREENYFTHKHNGNINKSIDSIGGYENQQLERGSLTEELNRPIFDFLLYDSSDSTCNIKQKYGCCCSFARPNCVSSETRLQCEKSLYRELTVNWVPLNSHKDRLEFDDQEWLFKRMFFKSNTSIEISSACNYDLPQVDICALPYTTLF
ncbi:hypothetical protein Pint_34301 [Pistacia integerrima]|uniref:Uncharacterized protein n=1 Tax=Pistacia integerrima TaxID=434235 RepID=A0ACC0X6A2_9ROSI|nr:hypothetical protein Pint_34301 [Pistacia integerrima]